MNFNEYSVEQQKAITLARKYLVEVIFASTKIEGIQTTLPDTENVLNNLPANMSYDDMTFIVNMKRCWQFLFENIEYPDNIMFIRELNKICGNGLFYDNGVIRTSDVTLRGCSYVPAIPVYSEVVECISKFNTISDPTIRAIIYLMYLSKAQLFIDGNKRVAQMMCNKILIENGVGILFIKDTNTYKKLLIEYYEDDQNVSNLLNFVKDECIMHIW